MSAEIPAIDAELAAFLREQGYTRLRVMPNGSIAGVRLHPFDCWLASGLNVTGYAERWCFRWREDAIQALNAWTGEGNPPGPWIRQRGKLQYGHGNN